MTMVAERINKAFAGTAVLKNVNMTLEPGSIHALVGENGAGKSTLLKILSGIYRTDSGTVKIGGADIYEQPQQKAKIAFVPTQCALYPDYNTKQLSKYYAGMYPHFNREKFEMALDGLAIGDKVVRKLSTGMSMALSVALALAVEPDVLLLDEPFAGLDVIFRRRLIKMLIDEAASRPVAMLVSSHNVDELERLCDKVTFLSRGEIVSSGDLTDVKQAAVRRLQVVFVDDPPFDLASWAGVIDLEAIGRVFTLNVDGKDQTIEKRLHDAGAMMIEELPVTLEDAFISSYEQGGAGK